MCSQACATAIYLLRLPNCMKTIPHPDACSEWVWAHTDRVTLSSANLSSLYHRVTWWDRSCPFRDCHQTSGKALQRWRLAYGMDPRTGPKKTAQTNSKDTYTRLLGDTACYTLAPPPISNNKMLLKDLFFFLSESSLQYRRWIEQGTV